VYYVSIMKINSDISRERAGRILDAYGSWGAVREAGTRSPNGVIMLPARPDPHPRHNRPVVTPRR